MANLIRRYLKIKVNKIIVCYVQQIAPVGDRDTLLLVGQAMKSETVPDRLLVRVTEGLLTSNINLEASDYE